MAFEKSYLIPPENLLKSYAVTADQFREHGYGFVYEFLVKRARLLQNERVLDLGCGPGHHARPLADYLTDSGSFEGLDIGSDAIDFCKTAYASHKNFKFTHADIHNEHYNPKGRLQQHDYKLPFTDAEFDLVYAVSLFTHLLPHELMSYLAEIRRVVKPNGRFVATFFLINAASLANMANEESRTRFRFPYAYGTHRLSSTEDRAAGVAYEEVWLQNMFRQNGLRACEITYGTWSGERDMLQSLQDIVLAVPSTRV